ncbi:hypothetical protein SDIAM26S_05223 [Streptomyces diastaticus subsp. diastaticus]
MQPAFRLVAGPFQAGEGAVEVALDGEDALAAGQTGVLAGAAAVHHQYVPLAQRLEGEGAQQ